MQRRLLFTALLSFTLSAHSFFSSAGTSEEEAPLTVLQLLRTRFSPVQAQALLPLVEDSPARALTLLHRLRLKEFRRPAGARMPEAVAMKIYEHWAKEPKDDEKLLQPTYQNILAGILDKASVDVLGGALKNFWEQPLWVLLEIATLSSDEANKDPALFTQRRLISLFSAKGGDRLKAKH